ncbi:DUF998 domain-containing protein [Stenotrophomonas sp.]|uniref:DUF998 domain-containing protein n=1 Tax=Stenotrophomonas sp. TaxID=69392 RepID=UPI002FC94BBC
MSMVWLDRGLGPASAVLFGLAVIGFGAGLPGYDQGLHPVALLGAGGVPHALAFNLLGWLLPGLLASAVAVRLLQALPADSGWPVRVGGQLLLLAGLAFAALGLLPLDLEDLDGRSSQWHASAWMIWALAFVAGSVLVGIGRLRQPGGRALGRLALGCGLATAVLAFALQGVLPAPLAQRLAFACWMLWLAAALPMARPR